jgi:hypothetical protein
VSWEADACRNADLVGTAEELGFTSLRGGINPCPACGVDQRLDPVNVFIGERDKRQRWKCHRCGAGGTVVDLVSFDQAGESHSPSQRPQVAATVRAWFAVRGACEPDPYQTPQDALQSPAPMRRPLPRPRAEEPRQPPPAVEVRALWDACVSVTDDPEVARWLADERGLDPGAVADLDLARALPHGVALPTWAAVGRQTWAAGGWRLILPCFDATGELATVKARRIATGAPKEVAPGGCSVVGTVYANGAARAMLTDRTPADVVITEGGPDWLTWAHLDAARAVFGVYTGGWGESIGERIPDGVRVALRTHDDKGGRKLAEAVRRTLPDRCEITEPPTGEHDDNDRLKEGTLPDGPFPKPSSWDQLAPIGVAALTTEPPERAWLLRRNDDDGLFPLGRVGILAGAGGVGKSFAVVDLAVAVAAGLPWFGVFPVDNPGRVLLAMGEETSEEINRRVYNVVKARKLTPAQRDLVATCLFPLPLAGNSNVALSCSDNGEGEVTTKAAGALVRALREHGPWSLIILDPMSRFAGPDAEKDNAAATRFVQVVESLAMPELGHKIGTRRVGPSVLLTHHTSQDARNQKDQTNVKTTATRGVTGLTDAVRWAATLVETDDGVQFTVGKSNYGPTGATLKLTRGPDGTLRKAAAAQSGQPTPGAKSRGGTHYDFEELL